MSALWADTLLRNEGSGLPRQCAHWLAMTVVFDTFRSKTSANTNERSLSLRGAVPKDGDVAIRILSIRRMLGGLWPPHSQVR